MIDKTILQSEILPHLSKGKCGKTAELDILEVAQAIFYRLKTGCQWRELPVKQFITRQVPTKWQAVYYHFNKWCKDGSWEKAWAHLLKKYRMYLDLSCINIDGSHTRVFRGGEAVGYQGRKKYRSTNIIFLVDNQGVVLFCSRPISGEHNDLYEIETYFDQILGMAKKAGISLEGLFLNGDGGFDSAGFRDFLWGSSIEANIAENKRGKKDFDSDIYFDEQLYERRAFCEHPFAWMDAFKGLLVRYEKLAATWISMNIMGMMKIFIRKIQTHMNNPQL